MKITLDTNVLYELESDRTDSALCELIGLSKKNQLALQIPAIAASERQPGGRRLQNFGDFQQRVARMGLRSAELLRPLAYVGLFYLDWALIIGPEQRKQERNIHEIMFPKIAFNAADHCPKTDGRARDKWRNAKCDVLAMWCHIYYGGDIFVTRDRHFLKTSVRPRLEAIGAKIIATPEETLEVLETTEKGPRIRLTKASTRRTGRSRPVRE